MRTGNQKKSDEQRREFGDWLRAHRQRLGIKQAEAGRRAHMSRTQWTRLELGASGTRRENIPLIAEAVSADLSETYRLAGYAPDMASEKRMAWFDRFNALPPHVQSDLAVQIEALWRKYKSIQ